MTSSKQWQFGYKDGQKPVQTGIVEASSLEKAELVARAWCAAQFKLENPGPTVKFCFVRALVVADESILEAAEPPKPVTSPLASPSRQ